MNFTLIFLNVGGGEMVIILLFVLMFFGSKNIPELARGLGKGMREIKDAMDGVQREIKKEVNEAELAARQHTDEFKNSLPELKKAEKDITDSLNS